MANDFNVHSIVANEALYWFENELVMGNLCWRGYEKEWRTINGHKIGDTVSIDRPARFVSVDGPDITGLVQDVVYGNKDIKLNIQKTVPFQFDARGLTTEADIRRVGEESIRAAASRLAQDVETAISGLYWQFANVYGTPGTPATVTKVLGQGGAIFTNLAVEMPGRSAVINPDMKVEFADQIKSLANTGKERAALERTRLGPLHNFDTYESASLVTHTSGNWVGTVLVAGAGQATTYALAKDTWVQNLNIDGLTNSGANNLKRGDCFTIAGCFEVNPGTLQSTGRLRRFTLQADATVTAGAATVSITPPIIPLTSATAADKANATVTAAPADNAVITPIFGGTAPTVGVQYRQNLLFHRKALSLIMKPLQKLESFTVWEQRSRKGLSLTLSKGGDIYKHSEVWRLDILFGVDVLHTDLGLRLTD
jgi:hypothetical protein